MNNKEYTPRHAWEECMRGGPRGHNPTERTTVSQRMLGAAGIVFLEKEHNDWIFNSEWTALKHTHT